MAFNGKRKGLNVSRHLQLKSVSFLKYKLERLHTYNPTEVKVANIVLGILKSRKVDDLSVNEIGKNAVFGVKSKLIDELIEEGWRRTFYGYRGNTGRYVMNDDLNTYWNNCLCKARKIVVKIDAVEVISWDGKPFIISNEDGEGWDKVTIGRGLPSWPHRSITNYEIVGEG